MKSSGAGRRSVIEQTFFERIERFSHGAFQSGFDGNVGEAHFAILGPPRRHLPAPWLMSAAVLVGDVLLRCDLR